jgi:orotate phosphoribosyltransferase
MLPTGFFFSIAMTTRTGGCVTCRCRFGVYLRDEVSLSHVNDSTLKAFLDTGAYLRGHFRLTSGLHSAEYLQSAKVLQHPHMAERLARDLADRMPKGNGVLAGVVSPALGGLIIGHEVARALGVRFVFTERDGDGKMTLRRGFEIQPGEELVVVEDVITTGGSTREVIDLLQAAGANVLGAGSIIDRSGGTADIGVPRVALTTLKPETWPQDFCPLCQQGVPVEKPGSRKS